MPPPLKDFDKRVLEAVVSAPGRKARAIAEELGVDRTLVNASLQGPLRA